MYSIKVLQKAEKEILDAAEWYASIYKDLGVSFREEINSKAFYLKNSPDIYKIIKDDVRKVSLNVFPYSLYFKIKEKDKKIVVFRLRHNSRKEIVKK